MAIAEGRNPSIFAVIWNVIRQIWTAIATRLEVFFGVSSASLPGFREEYEERYGPENTPNFYAGTLRQAAEEAKRNGCLLAIYVHCDLAQFTDVFCKTILCNDGVRRLLNDRSKFVLWGSPETRELQAILRPSRFPHISVVMPRSLDERVGLVEGVTTADELISVLVGCLHTLEEYRHQWSSAAAQRQTDRDILEEQNREYEEALLQDVLRESALSEERERLRREAEAQQRMQEEVEAKDQERRLRRSNLAEKFREGGSLDVHGSTTMIRVRLPDGGRIERTFPTTASLQDVYHWVEAAEYLHESLSPGTISDSFRLQDPYSFSALATAKMDATLEDLHLVPNASLLFVRLDDD